MSEWWTYSLSSFLLFSPTTYYRLFELYNRDIWPLQLLGLALGATVAVLLWRWRGREAEASWRHRAVWAILAGCWLWVAWGFHLQRYATINWAATWFAAGFALQAALLAMAALLPEVPRLRLAAHPARLVGIGLYLVALLAWPLLAPLLGRAWAQAEVFAVAPDPTAAATLGLLLLTGGRFMAALLAVPVLWCAASGATLWAMGMPDALLLPAAAVLGILSAGWGPPSRRPEAG